MTTPDPNYWGNPPKTPGSKNSQPPTPQSPLSSAQQQKGATTQTIPTEEPAYQQQQQQQQQQNPYITNTPNQKRNTGVIVGVVVAALLVLCLVIGGCTAVQSLVSQINALSTNNQNSSQYSEDDFDDKSDNDRDSDATEQQSDTEYQNQYLRELFDLGSSDDEITSDELETITKTTFSSYSTTPDENGLYSPGVYHVGTDLDAGTYWFYGSDNTRSYYFVLDPSSDDANEYDVKHLNNYYGHNLMEVSDGQVLIVANNRGMVPLDKMTETFSSPYTNGVFRVGTDIPAGTYTLSLGSANDYSAYYIMNDLTYSDSSITESEYYLYDDKVKTTITLKEGTYVELFNMTLTPSDKSA